MYTDVNVAIFEFDRRSVWPHFELIQLGSWHILQRTDPLSWNHEAGIAVCDDLDGVPHGNVANGSLKSPDSASGDYRPISPCFVHYQPCKPHGRHLRFLHGFSGIQAVVGSARSRHLDLGTS
jgi:hypothetical protein